MKSSRTRWMRGMRAVVLVVGVLVLGTGNVVTQAGERDDDHNQRNPFHQILDKLDHILAAIKGGGGQDGNHTLRWDANSPSASRFTTAFPGAVLDKNTGLVWEQAPDATTRTWFSATVSCVNKTVGGTVGWRLPSVVELKSVQDPSLPAPFVPASVFTDVQSDPPYWSATTDVALPSNAWLVVFLNGFVDFHDKALPLHAWCVRGDMNADQY